MEEVYGDRLIAALRAKYDEKMAEKEPVGGEIVIGNSKILLKRETLFGGKCSMMLPDIMKDMAYRDRMEIYPKQSPPVVKTDGDATITFSSISMTEAGRTESAYQLLMRMRKDMKKVRKQNVFYETGEETAGGLAVAWMDHKGFCLDGALYSMVFLFRMGEEYTLGDFHCSFPQYDIWKPVMKKLLTTIQVDE